MYARNDDIEKRSIEPLISRSNAIYLIVLIYVLDETYDNDYPFMKIIKRLAIVMLILFTGVFVFRGWIYRHISAYKSFGVREKYSVTDSSLMKLLDETEVNQDLKEISEVINSSLSLTSKQLNFTDSTNDLDPNKLVTSKTAHCVGYANFFAAVCNYQIQKHNLSQEWEATARIGHIFLLGTDIHAYFKSSFFKDHDFVIIENRVTGEVFAVDPTLHDYSGIKLVHFQKE